jgi:uncharacterized protein (TIGR02246 family)
MRPSRTIAIVGSLLVLASCQSTHRVPEHHQVLPKGYGVTFPAPHDPTPFVQELLDGIMAADNAGDLDRVMTYYTADAVLLPPKGATMTGREAIRAHYGEAFQALTLSMSATIDEIRGAGDWAVVRGQVKGTITEKASGDRKQAHDRFLAIADRDSEDGRWRFSRLSWAPME